METETNFELTEGDSPVVLDEVKLHQMVSDGQLHFDEWTSLISEIENTCPDNIERICLVYDSFLSVFPLCYGYWRKYVHHKIRLSTVEEVVEVFERSVLSATYCVDMWVDYCNFGRLVFENQSDVRRLFKRAISFVGKNFLCHTLWDKYIEFEFSLKQWSLLANLYIQALRFPTKKLHRYHENFKKLVEIWEGGMKCHINTTVTVEAEPILKDETYICYNQDILSSVIKDLFDASVYLDRLKALHKYKSLGEGLFQQAVQLYEKVNFFEARIKRSYFHVKPLDVSQLQNWHDYLDFAESHGDFNWAVQLYERCLIPCANFPEFWMRYVEFLERKGGREIANYALDRATQIHLKRLSVIHLFNARFKEHIGDVFNARAAFLQCNITSDKDFVENVVKRANMEKRLGKSVAASTIYEDALEKARAKEKWDILPVLYVHFSRLKYNITDCQDAAIDILIDGINHVPSCKLLIEELVKFAMMHQGSRHINMIDSIVATAISPQPGGSQGLTPEDGEEISKLHLEFVDLCGTVCDVRKAWNRHIRLFPLSVRDALFHPAMKQRKWKLTLEARKKTADPVTDEQKSPLLANHDVGSTQLSDQQSPLMENLDKLSEKAKTDMLQSRESNSENSYQVALEGSDLLGENIVKPKLSPDPENQIVSVTENASASLQFNEENDVEKEDHYKVEQELKLPSLETLSIDTQDANAAQISPPIPDPGKTSLSDGSEAPQKNSTSDENITGKALPWPPNQASGRNWHQSNKFSRDSKFGFRGHSHKRQHRHRHSSPQRTHQRSVNENYRSYHGTSQNPQRQGGQVLSSYPPSNAYTNGVDSQDWLMHSSQQNLSAPYQSQQPTQQIPQYSLQSNETQQNLQNNQAYNEAWQYYYYQQQLLWQQQLLQQGQQSSQQEQQQLMQYQYQQQLLQMQYIQQQGQQPQISYQQQEGPLQQQPYQLQQQQQQLLYLQQQQQLQLQPEYQSQQQYYQQQAASSQHEQEQGQSQQQTDTPEIQDGVAQSCNAGESQTNESSASPQTVYPNYMA